MAHYFRYVPNFDYVSRLPNSKIGDYIQIKNFFRRGNVVEDIFNNLVFFEKYNVQGDERPDTVAKNYYGDPTLDWVVFLSNNYTNVQNEWPLTQKAFDKVMLDKYGSYENLYSGIHHYESSEIKDSRGRIILKQGTKLDPNWKNNGNFCEIPNTTIESLSYSLVDGIPVGLITTTNNFEDARAGDEIYIQNVMDVNYNGKYFIESVLSSNTFSFILDSISDEETAILRTPRTETIRINSNPAVDIEGSINYFEFYDEGFGYTVAIPSSEFLIPVTNYDYEVQIEDRKREIFLLKPQYLNILFDDLEGIMTYRTGSSQFVDRKLKRGDNIKLGT